MRASTCTLINDMICKLDANDIHVIEQYAVGEVPRGRPTIECAAEYSLNEVITMADLCSYCSAHRFNSPIQCTERPVSSGNYHDKIIM